MRETKKNPTFSHSQKPVVWLSGWYRRARLKDGDEELSLCLLNSCFCKVCPQWWSCTLFLPLSLSLVLPDVKRSVKSGEGMRYREREREGGGGAAKSGSRTIHMQMSQGASTNPWEEKDKPPLPPPSPSHGWAASEWVWDGGAGLQPPLSSKCLWPIKPISWIQLWFSKNTQVLYHFLLLLDNVLRLWQ